MKQYFRIFALLLVVPLCAAMGCTSHGNSDSDISEVLELDVDHIYYADGKTFVEMSITNKTSETVEIGETETSEARTCRIQIVKGVMLVDEGGNGYESSFPNRHAVYAITGKSKRKCMAVFEADLRHVKLKELSWVITYFKQGCTKHYVAYDLRAKVN